MFVFHSQLNELSKMYDLAHFEQLIAFKIEGTSNFDAALNHMYTEFKSSFFKSVEVGSVSGCVL